ncbi:MAG: tetratricopeptide repeat protein [bacterium]
MAGKTKRIFLLLILIALVIILQTKIDVYRVNYRPKEITSFGYLSREVLATALMGLREVAAGLLWLKIEDYFHSGEHEKIPPLIRIITWLDPHFIEAYSSGAWQLAWNSEDWRLIPSAEEFLKEGIQNNPDKYELYADMGWLYYDKVRDYDKAIEWYKRASALPSPPQVKRMLAHSYERAGKIDEAIKIWKSLIEEAKKEVEKNPKNFEALFNRDVAIHNYNMCIIRKVDRAELPKRAKAYYLSYQVYRVSPRILQIRAKTNLPELSRIKVSLVDADIAERKKKSLGWQLMNVTEYIDVWPQVKKGEMKTDIDLTDALKYPLKGDRFILTLSFLPQTQPVAVQDVVGWLGEGMAGGDVIALHSSPPKKKLEKSTILTLNDITGQKTLLLKEVK